MWCFQKPAQGHLVLSHLRDRDLHDDQHRLLHDRVTYADGQVHRGRCRKWTHRVTVCLCLCDSVSVGQCVGVSV